MPPVVPQLGNPFGLGFIQALLAGAQLLAATSATPTQQFFPQQTTMQLAAAASGNPMFGLPVPIPAVLPSQVTYDYNLSNAPFERATESPLAVSPDSPPAKLARMIGAPDASASEPHDTSGSDDLPNMSNGTEKRKQRKPFSHEEDCILIEGLFACVLLGL